MDEAENKELINRIHSTYLEYNKTIRVWFVGYGIGTPVLILTQKHLYDQFTRSENAWLISMLYLAGVLIQVVSSIVNKWTNWVRYNEYLGLRTYPKWLHNFADSWRDTFWANAALDVVTALIFSGATFGVFNIITK